MTKYASIGKAAEMLGVSHSTLRRWDESGKLVAERTPGGRRRYLISDVATFNPLGLERAALSRPTVAYARVSSHDRRLIWSDRCRCWRCTVPRKAGSTR